MEHSHSTDEDLDKTDRLPILEGTIFDQDVEDDAVPMDRTAVLPGLPLAAARSTPPDFVRSSGVDLPSLAESVRSVEERIARQSAEYEALTRAYERSRDAELASVARANALAADLASARTTLSTHDATMVQVLQSLAERDAQLAALQGEHAKIVPALEASTRSAAQLEADLRAARSRSEALALEVKGGERGATELAAVLKRKESEMTTARFDLAAVKKQATAYLEKLRTREWRHGFNQNMFRDLDAKVGAAQASRSALESERDQLQARAAATEAQRVKESAAAETERLRLTAELAARDRSVAELMERRGAADKRIAVLLEAAEQRQADQAAEVTKLRGDQTAEVAKLRGEHATEVAKLRGEHATEVAKLRDEQAAQVAHLQSDAETREQEMGVLMAHLQEARRPIQIIEAEVKRLTEELAAKTAVARESEDENAKLRASLERTKGALEEREFLIRRLERSESNNANVLGRIQTSIERLGAAPAGSGTLSPELVGGAVVAGPTSERSAELIRIDNGQPITHVLSRRTRIGRAAGCELQIESSSVSRNHALVLVGPRETIIEDLNSTNGVLVNGRKVSRQLLSDGDAITIGEIQFRYLSKPLAPGADADSAETGAGQ
jgi:chromosome segregation ATPase